MVEFIVVQAAANSLARNYAARHDNVKWCSLNDETVYWTSTEHWKSLPDEVRRLGGPPQTATGKLYLVVQNGNAFLSHFPWVRVVVNKGRHLVVNLTSKQVKDIGKEPACFGMCPLPENKVVFETCKRTQRQQAPEIAALVSMVSQERLTNTLTRLASFRTRHSLTAEFSAAADLMKDELEAIGFTVSKRAITVGTGGSFNVVVDRPGSGTIR